MPPHDARPSIPHLKVMSLDSIESRAPTIAYPREELAGGGRDRSQMEGLTGADEMIYIISQGPTMRYPAQHKQQTRQRIVRAAARRFRSRGAEGATIGSLMRDLRLTHRGFYPHFVSKKQPFTHAF